MKTPHDRSEPAASFWLSLIFVLGIVGLPILYVLSIGPVIAVVEGTGLGREAAEVIYAPVVWLHDHTPLKRPLEVYAEFWGWQ